MIEVVNMEKTITALSFRIHSWFHYLAAVCFILTFLLQITVYSYSEQVMETIRPFSTTRRLANYDSTGKHPGQHWKQPHLRSSPENNLHQSKEYESYENRNADLLCANNNERTQKCQLSSCNFLNTLEFSHGYAGNTFKKNDSINELKIVPTVGGHGWANGCVISHKYKFIYVHVLKSGGTSIKHFLREGLCGSPHQGGPCPGGPEIFDTDSMKCADMISNYPDYFTWTTVRNPFSRIFSAYAMSLSFAKVKISFETFVLTKMLRKRTSTMSSDHYLPQVQFLFNQNECPIFDYMGRIENMEEDMSYILDKIGSSELKELFQSQNKAIERLNTWGKTRRENVHGGDLNLVYENEEVRQAIAEEFAKDFRLLGYDPDIIPHT